MCRYREHILVFVSYSSASEEEQSAAEERCLAVAAQEAGLYGGAGETMHLSDGDLSIRQALAAVASAQRQGLRLVRWADLHLASFAITARHDRLFTSASELHRSKLATYDGGTAPNSFARPRRLSTGTVM